MKYVALALAFAWHGLITHRTVHKSEPNSRVPFPMRAMSFLNSDRPDVSATPTGPATDGASSSDDRLRTNLNPYPGLTLPPVEMTTPTSALRRGLKPLLQAEVDRPKTKTFFCENLRHGPHLFMAKADEG
ncbi:uncharacterized protein E0L32_009667 [Thyridium curvatum]|uniref:Uncharacterized protein n=1 Tax=Thyridium curvatum TaxID=1093900 RepID=A0A507AV81_9PEZI|nr:uncharacterized protein E0L32_009667 [Thyridium curvatum]TPX08849.1 hypothetical protein E0L32_009667 [Thyridium curvatum]